MNEPNAGRLSAKLLISETPLHQIVYLIGGAEEAAAVWRLIEEPKPVLAVINGADWERDLSPWPAPRAFRGGADFSGGASEALEIITKLTVPQAESMLGFLIMSRAIAGYSLAGLFAVWALYNTDTFDRAASVSGSLWYDGFAEYALTHAWRRKPDRAYFSLGDRERLTKSPRMAAVEECTHRVAEEFQAQHVNTLFELNPGGHFSNVPERIAKGIRYLSH